MSGSSKMKTLINHTLLELLRGDIAEQETEAIVNAANNTLLGGGGVDGAIHRAGGPAILDECRAHGGCETGDAKITTGGNLKAKYVIHTVGPIYSSSGDADLLASCYRRSLETASKEGISSISFPSISTGSYGYPIKEASRVALNTVIDYVQMREDIDVVRFVLFSEEDQFLYEEALKEILAEL
jgi:O-acetyl-ADP-ribose deacetylase (regulator of RNase III)